MASGDRRMSFDRIHSNNRQEGAQSDDDAPSYDLESVSSYATTAETAVLSDRDNHRRHAGPSSGGSSIDQADSGSTLTLRRGSNPENLLPTGGRFQPGDEPERREEAPQPIDRHQHGDQVNITMDIPAPQPQCSEDDIDRGTKFILCAGGFVVLFFDRRK